MLGKIKHRIYEIIEVSGEGDKLSKFFDIFIITLIILNIVAVTLETVESLNVRYGVFFVNFEIFSVIIFTVEYLLRFWTCDYQLRFKDGSFKRLKFAMTPMAIIDLLAILPFYLAALLPFDLRIIRILRLFRILRVLKISRYSESIRSLASAVRSKKEELFVSVVILIIIMVIASSLMYFAENEAQPEVFSSIPVTMWWAFSNMPTVNFEDIYPVTLLGKFLGAVFGVALIGLIALPAAIIVSGYFKSFLSRNVNKNINSCPHCGKSFDKMIVKK